MRESAYPMIPVAEALAHVLRSVARLPATPQRFDEALGLVLAAPVMAGESLPPFPASTVDGFAVRAAEGMAARRLVGAQFAGYDAALHVGPGEAARITTGAPLPAGSDAVMMVEWSDERDGWVAFTRTVAAGDFVRSVGSDIAAGQPLLAAGTLLGAAEIGLLATVGATVLHAHRRPCVGVMSTGDELVEPDATPGPGQIRDANRYSLMAAAREAGADALDLGIAPDAWQPLLEFVAAGRLRCDVLITTGGVSMGELDLVKPLLEQQGHVLFGRVNLKPGKPTTFGLLGGTPFFALPGNPVSSLVTFELFVRPALRKMAGLPQEGWQRPRTPATLAHAVRHGAERDEFQRAQLRLAGGRFVATTTGNQASSRLLSMQGANALLHMPAGHGDYAAGDEVEAWLVGDMR